MLLWLLRGGLARRGSRGGRVESIGLRRRLLRWHLLGCKCQLCAAKGSIQVASVAGGLLCLHLWLLCCRCSRRCGCLSPAQRRRLSLCVLLAGGKGSAIPRAARRADSHVGCARRQPSAVGGAVHLHLPASRGQAQAARRLLWVPCTAVAGRGRACIHSLLLRSALLVLLVLRLLLLLLLQARRARSLDGRQALCQASKHIIPAAPAAAQRRLSAAWLRRLLQLAGGGCPVKGWHGRSAATGATGAGQRLLQRGQAVPACVDGRSRCSSA